MSFTVSNADGSQHAALRRSSAGAEDLDVPGATRRCHGGLVSGGAGQETPFSLSACGAGGDGECQRISTDLYLSMQLLLRFERYGWAAARSGGVPGRIAYSSSSRSPQQWRGPMPHAKGARSQAPTKCPGRAVADTVVCRLVARTHSPQPAPLRNQSQQAATFSVVARLARE